jgi:hypothetical protein
VEEGSQDPAHGSPAEAHRLLLELRGLWATGLFRARDRLAILGPRRWAPSTSASAWLRPLVGPAVTLEVIRMASLPAGPERADLTWRP